MPVYKRDQVSQRELVNGITAWDITGVREVWMQSVPRIWLHKNRVIYLSGGS